MASFSTLDWRRLDTFAILAGRGLATLEPGSTAAGAAWLKTHHYRTIPLDFSQGISPVVSLLGKILSWSEQFGYELTGDSRNLAALHDGFHMDVPENGGLALEITAFDQALKEDETWSTGFLAILSDHSLRQLAQARRFFSILYVASDESPVVGLSFDKLSVPYPIPFDRA